MDILWTTATFVVLQIAVLAVVRVFPAVLTTALTKRVEPVLGQTSRAEGGFGCAILHAEVLGGLHISKSIRLEDKSDCLSRSTLDYRARNRT